MDDVRIEPARHRLNVDDYYRMAEVGILGWGSRVELIDGEIIDMAPISPGHAATVNGLSKALVMAGQGRGVVSVQNPVRLDRLNELQPDVAVLRPPVTRYRAIGHPAPADILLLVEVADSTLRFDCAVKLPLYARSGVAELWIVDLQHRVLEAHCEPVNGTYAMKQTYTPNSTITLAMMPEVTLCLSEVFR